MGEVGDDDVGPTAGSLHLGGDLVEFGLGARGDDDVGADFGERHRDGRPEAAAGSGDYGYLSVQTKPVEDH